MENKKEKNGAFVEIKKNSIRFHNPNGTYTYNNLSSFLEFLRRAMQDNPNKSRYFGSGIGKA